MTDFSLLDKIRKLKEKADSAFSIGSVKEAEIFSAKVTELLQKYNLELVDIPEKELADACIKQSFPYGKLDTEGHWELNLAFALADHNLCKVLFVRRRPNWPGSITVIGKKENVEVMIYLHEIVCNQARESAKILWKERLDSERLKWAIRCQSKMDYIIHSSDEWGFELREVDIVKIAGTQERDGSFLYAPMYPSSRRCDGGQMEDPTVWRSSFLAGVVVGIEDRLYEEELIRRRSENGTALVLVKTKHQEAIEKFVQKEYPNVKSASHSTEKSTNLGTAYKQGKEVGKNVRFTPGIKSGNSTSVGQLNS